MQDESSLIDWVDVQKDSFLCLTVRLCRPICSVVREFHFNAYMLIWSGMRKLMFSVLVAISSSQHNLYKSENKSINRMHNLLLNGIIIYLIFKK